MSRTVVLSAARTPFGKLGGGLSSVDATELGGTAIEAALERAEVKPDQVQHVVMGQVLQAGQGQIPSRQAQIKAGIPKEVSSETVNKVCASSLRAVGIVDQAVRAGDLELAVAGGMESMSRGALPAAQGALRLPHGRRQGGRRDDPRRAHQPVHGQDDGPGGLRGRRGARDDPGRPRQVRAAQPPARRAGDRRGPARGGDRARDGVLARRATPPSRPTRARAREATLETLAKLKPISEGGTHTAGNSPGVNDGAGALVLAAEEWAKANDREWLATIIAQAAVADDFAYLARTPAKATDLALEKAGLKIDDIDLFEINEAFASVALNSMRMLGVDEDRVNVNGGAIALGHPIGASGARILTTLIWELRRRGGGRGVAAICSGGGQGDAVIVEV